MKRCVVVLLALGLAVTPLARADEIHDLLEKVSAVLTKTVEQHQNDKKKRAQFEEMADDVKALRENTTGDKMHASEALRVMRHLTVNSETPTEAKVLMGQLGALLMKVADVQRQEAGAVLSTDEAAQLDVLLQKAAEACLAAKKDSDLDGVLKELNALRQSRHGSGTEETRNFLKRESALRFVTRWQYYLRQRAAGNDDRAEEVIREFSQTQTGDYPLLTRDQLKSLLPPEPKVDSLETLLRGVKSLDELPKLIAEVGTVNSKRRSIDQGANETAQSLNELNEIYKAHAAAKAGLYQNALQTATNILNNLTRPGSAELIRMKTLLLAEVLPAYVDLPGDVKPREGENPSQFLLRIADEAVAKGDWDRVQRVLDVYRTSAFGMRPPTWLQGEIAACSAYLAAQKLENAGDIKRAASEYEKVLLQSGKRIPTADATARLARIAKEHPEALEGAGAEVKSKQ